MDDLYAIPDAPTQMQATPEMQDPAMPAVLDGADLIRFLDDLEKRGMAVTKDWAQTWQENLLYFFGEQLGDKPKLKDWDWIVVNYMWPAAMSEIAKLARHNPKIIVTPYDTSDMEAAEVWEGILQWMADIGLNEHGIRIEQIYANLDKKLFGYCVYKTFWNDRDHWDDQTKQWVGEIEGKLWHPAHFWASDRESVYKGPIGTVRFVELEYAKKLWPGYAEKLEEKSTSNLEDLDTYGGDTIRGQTSTTGTYPGVGYGDPDRKNQSRFANRILNLVEGSGIVGEDPLKFVKIQETWWFDYTSKPVTVEQPVSLQDMMQSGGAMMNGVMPTNPATGQPIDSSSWPTQVVAQYDEPLFPNGRWVIRCDDLILNPEIESQRYPYHRWPFVICPHYILPHMWQGSDAIQLYKSTQDMINTTVSHLVNNMKQFGDPRIAVEKGAIDVPKGRDQKHFEIGKGAGRIIRLVRGGLSRFKILPPEQPSAIVYQLYALFQQEFKNIIGLQDISVGKQGNRLTATEASALVTNSNDRIMLQSVFEEAWLRNVMAMCGEMAQIHYEPGRYVRLVGQDKMAGITAITQRLKTVRYDVGIEVGSTLPFDEEKKIAKIKEAYMATMSPTPGPMLPELLEGFGIQGWQKILQRVQVWQGFMQYQQMIQAVNAGKIPPEVAIQGFMGQLRPPMPPQGPPGQPGQQGSQPQGNQAPMQQQGVPNAG